MRSLSDILNRARLSARESAAPSNRAADEWMANLASGAIYALDAALQDNLRRTAGTALANRFIFACLDDNPGEEREAWVFMPLARWAQTGRLYALTGPLEGLLPEGALEIAEGTWMWDEQKSKLDRALSLMAHGFIWHPAFQKRVDKTQINLTIALARLARGLPPSP